MIISLDAARRRGPTRSYALRHLRRGAAPNLLSLARPIRIVKKAMQNLQDEYSPFQQLDYF